MKATEKFNSVTFTTLNGHQVLVYQAEEGLISEVLKQKLEMAVLSLAVKERRTRVSEISYYKTSVEFSLTTDLTEERAYVSGRSTCWKIENIHADEKELKVTYRVNWEDLNYFIEYMELV